MPHFPMFIDLNNKPVLVVGGGLVAFRKIQKLMPYGPEITVVAPEIIPEIEKLAKSGEKAAVTEDLQTEKNFKDAAGSLQLVYRSFEETDLDRNPEMVIVATDDRAVNHTIAEWCKNRKIPVNVVDEPEECSFLFPALVQNGKFSVGISTGGASPTAAIHYKEKIKELVPDHLDEILDWLEEQRPLLKKTIPDQSKRAGVFRAMFDACMKKGSPLTEDEMETYINEKKEGSVALVGAGCGKADLITVRGLKLLKQCQAVVYDDLIDPELLEEVPESARRIYMGKRSGAHSAPQQEINETLIALAKEGLQVVRLKGGDPYLFGRGGEEMLALLEAGIPCQEVPGIPSAIGIAAEAGIPVTHRGASRGLHIVTAHTSDTEDFLPKDFDHLAKLEGTLVFLMGLKQLPRIAARLMAAGKSPETPAAVLSGGNSAHPAQVRSTLSGIVQAVEEAGVQSPAIIMVGEVTALDLSWCARQVREESEKNVKSARKEKITNNETLESSEENENMNLLRGAVIGITGTKEVAAKQETAMEKLGAATHWVSRSVVTERTISFEPEQAKGKTSWLVFTSSNGVKTFFRQMKDQGKSLEGLKHCKFAVIGSATGETLKSFGYSVDLCPETFTSEGLAKELVQVAKTEEEIILLRSSIGSPILPKVLKEHGFVIQDISIYDLEQVEAEQKELPYLNYLTFSSASGVELFFAAYGAVPEGVKCVCIGEVTAKALEKHTDVPYLLAEEITVGGIVASIVKDWNRT